MCMMKLLAFHSSVPVGTITLQVILNIASLHLRRESFIALSDLEKGQGSLEGYTNSRNSTLKNI